MYAASGIRNQLVKIEPDTRRITVLGPDPPDPTGNLLNFNDAWAGAEGMFFSQTTGNKITFYNYTSGTFDHNWMPPTPLSGPLGIEVDYRDGTVWFAEFFANKIGQLNPVTGEIKEFPLPLLAMGPGVVRVQQENLFWFTLLTGNGLARIDTNTGDIKLYFSPQVGSAPAENDQDLHVNIFFSTFASNTVNYFDPKTETFHQIDIPGGAVADERIPPGISVAMHYYKPGNIMWFTQVSMNRVGYYMLDPQ